MTRELLQQALDALETNQYAVADAAPHADVMAYNDAITALREAIAAPMPEPVAWIAPGGVCVSQGVINEMNDEDRAMFPIPLYAAPPAAPAPVVPDDDLRQLVKRNEELFAAYHASRAAPVVREPLTDEQIRQIVRDTFDVVPLSYDITFARAIEKAHGIGGGNG